MTTHTSHAPETARPAADDERARRRFRPVHFLRALLRALVDEKTYDVRNNPPLVVGFCLALPIPLLTWLSGAPLWLHLLSLPAPLFWGAILGAAGRVGIDAVQEVQQLDVDLEETRSAAQATEAGLIATQADLEEALDEEMARRAELEQREKRVLNELKLAAAVHRTLVPHNIQRPDVEVAVRQIPSQFVGGDYLYASVSGNRYLYLVVGDVSGHGVSAALVVARLHGLVRRLTLAKRSRPLTILERINSAALEIFQHTYFFLTVGVFRLDLATGKLRYATAGHPAQVLIRKDGRLEHLRTPNRLLGMDYQVFDSHHPADQIQMEEGDSLVLFTDGLFEILSGEDGRILDEHGLHERIASLHGLSPALMVGEILQELADFQGSSTFEDDVSLMVTTWKGPHVRGAS